MFLGNNMNAILVFSILCLIIFTAITYYACKEMRKDDEEIHRLAQSAKQKSSHSNS